MAMETELISKVKNLLVSRHGSDDVRALRSTFETYDRNKSGCLEAEELGKVLEDADIGNRLTRGMWVKGILARLDRSKRGALSWDDFVVVLDVAA